MMVKNSSKIVQRIQKQIFVRENSYQNLCMGMTGTGKSLSCITFATEINPKPDAFTIKRNVIMNPKKFLKFINSNPEPGTPILGDEIGKWFSNRDWYSFQNKIMSVVLETNRFMRIAAFWTVPSMRMVDVTLRDLCHSTTETLGINYKLQRCIAKFKYRQVNPMTGKGYDKFPRIKNAKGETITIDRIRIARPHPELEAKYLDKKERVLKNYYLEVEKFLEKGEKIVKRRKKNKKAMIIKDLEKGIAVATIAKKRNTASRYVREIRQEMNARDL